MEVLGMAPSMQLALNTRKLSHFLATIPCENPIKSKLPPQTLLFSLPSPRSDPSLCAGGAGMPSNW